MPRGPAVSLNLKQRLGQLATAASAPNTPASPPPSSARRSYFPTWGPKRANTVESLASLSIEDDEKVQEVVSKLIFQAGVDFETKPMVVVCACAFPDPREVSYDHLLTRIIAYLDLYVESDYTVVFFSAGNKHTPGWNWIWKAYRSLARKYRKNLKKLYIVHSTWFSKMLVSLAGAVVSPKFFRKIQYMNTLTSLAQYVPLTQIDVPPEVYRENLKYEKQITLPVAHRSSLFGVPLEDLMGADGEKGGIPRVVKDCAQYLRHTGMMDEGLFRRSPNTVMLTQAKQAYDRGHPVSLQSFNDAHLAAVLLKKFLKDLPEPIVPEDCYSIIRRCPLPTDDPADLAAVQYIRDQILPSLHSHAAVMLLSYILHLMHDVSLRSLTNRMDSHNLALVLSPNLVAGSNPARDVEMCCISGATNPAPFGLSSRSSADGKMTVASVIKICIDRYFEIFDELPDRAEATAPTASNSMELPPTPPFVLSDDTSSDNASVVAMQSSPLNKSGLPAGGAVRGSASPPSAFGKSRYRVMSTPPSAMPAASAFSPLNIGAPATRSLYAGAAESAAGGPSLSGTMRSKTRSLLALEKSLGPSGGRNLTLGKSAGTLRKSTGAAVEAVSVTASGFFTAPGGGGSVPPPVEDSIVAPGDSAREREGKSRELSEVSE